ncbi:MAG: hypothetical protein KGK33_01690 [Hyphomicrobiales bacterium]|nr:hypothetical protein [Hyphomicrobiales bacterium]
MSTIRDPSPISFADLRLGRGGRWQRCCLLIGLCVSAVHHADDEQPDDRHRQTDQNEPNDGTYSQFQHREASPSCHRA